MSRYEIDPSEAGVSLGGASKVQGARSRWTLDSGALVLSEMPIQLACQNVVISVACINT